MPSRMDHHFRPRTHRWEDRPHCIHAAMPDYGEPEVSAACRASGHCWEVEYICTRCAEYLDASADWASKARIKTFVVDGFRSKQIAASRSIRSAQPTRGQELSERPRARAGLQPNMSFVWLSIAPRDK